MQENRGKIAEEVKDVTVDLISQAQIRKYLQGYVVKETIKFLFGFEPQYLKEPQIKLLEYNLKLSAATGDNKEENEYK